MIIIVEKQYFQLTCVENIFPTAECPFMGSTRFLANIQPLTTKSEIVKMIRK